MANNFGIIRAKDFDASNLTFSELKQNKKGGYFVNVYYNGKPLRMQLPKMRLPFGASLNYNKDGYHCDFSFSGMDTSASLQKVHTALKSLDNAIIDTAVERSATWFKKKKSREVCEDNYTPLVRSTDKTDKDGNKYSDTLRAKLSRNQDNHYQMEVYDSKQNRVNLIDSDTEEAVDIQEVIPKGSSAVTIVQCSSVWFMSGTNYGLTCRVGQMQLFTNSNTIKGFAIQQDSDNEGDESDTESSGSGTGTKVEEEEEEVPDSDAEAEVVEDEPEPEPAPVKKPVTRRATRGRSTAALKSALGRGK